ncbi:AzlD family protein [Rosenbergiella nectarea]|uniref:AzlD family protein n=1 Tax=Rosenbergiella nectarea TaxID=988801 RepID=UPI0030B8D6E0
MNILPVATILLMALSTYFTRIIGYLLLRNRQLSPRMQAIMDAAPGCVLITIISPYFVTDKPTDLLALAISLFAASRWSLLPVVVISVVSTALLRCLL